MTRVLCWVQHLLGSGHVERMRRVAEALVARGAEVTFVTGGLPLPGRMPAQATVVQLPPLRAADATYATLVDAAGAPAGEALLAARTRALLEAFARARPQVIVLETYPFGRRALRRELDALLAAAAAASPRPRVATSLRDLLQRRDPARDAAAWALARQHVDLVLVHGEPWFARLEETLPPAADGAVPVAYTGYVAGPGAPHAPEVPRDEVLVAASGGEAGGALLDAAPAARARSALGALPWRLRVGPGVPAARFDALVRAGADAGVRVERHADDFAQCLRRARVAVTQAGYNTVLDVLRARAPSVLVPFAAHGETEQPMRAARLAALGRAEVVDESQLTPSALAAAVDRAAARGPMPACPFALDGAQRAADRLLALA